MHKTADNQAISKSSVICTLNYYVLSRIGMTVFNDHLTAGRHTAGRHKFIHCINRWFVLGKQTQIEITRGIIPIRKKFHDRKRRKMITLNPETWTVHISQKKKKKMILVHCQVVVTFNGTVGAKNRGKGLWWRKVTDLHFRDMTFQRGSRKVCFVSIKRIDGLRG